jgi:hypothetical protein
LIAITPKITSEKRNDTLAEWNTTGLKPGQYLLHLRVSNTAEIPVAVDAVKTISLNPGVFGIDQYETTRLKIFPNPVTDILHCDFQGSNSLVSISNSNGAIVWQDFPEKDSSTINVKHLPAGLYILTIFDNGRMGKARFIKM